MRVWTGRQKDEEREQEQEMGKDEEVTIHDTAGEMNDSQGLSRASIASGGLEGVWL